MIAMIEGQVMRVYEADTKDRDGNPAKVIRADIYDGFDLLRVTRLPDFDTLEVGSQVRLWVKVYGEHVALVYDRD